LILDSHSSRENIEALLEAKKKHLTILTYPGKSTHLLQPLDVSLFKPFKQQYKALYYSNERIAKPTLNDIFLLIKQAWSRCFTPTNILDSFASFGIYSINESKILAKIKEPSSKSSNLAVQDLPTVFASPLVIEVNTNKQFRKNRLNISNNVLTGEEIIEKLEARLKEKEKKEKRRKK